VAKHMLIRIVPVCVLVWAVALHAAPTVLAPELLKDPMKAPRWATTQVEDQPVAVEISVSAIIYRPKGAMAVINGQRVRVGDTVADAKVTRIEPKRVQVHTRDGRQWLSLSAPESIKVRRR
jgi:MSHA biogenesis protein MshK